MTAKVAFQQDVCRSRRGKEAVAFLLHGIQHPRDVGVVAGAETDFRLFGLEPRVVAAGIAGQEDYVCLLDFTF